MKILFTGTADDPQLHVLHSGVQKKGKKMTMIMAKPNRDPDFIIGPEGTPYMLRWWLIPRNELFNVYYHEILHDDDDRALHDHPWSSVSLLIKGSLREITKDGEKVYVQGDIVHRTAELAHRLELCGPEKTAETLFITGPVIRDWGFHCPKSWVPWREFVSHSEKGNIGQGCGEN